MFSRLTSISAGRGYMGTRQIIHIDDQAFSFQLYKPFSRDFPAQALPARADTRVLDDTASVHLARRWWDIKRSGFFAANIGSLMLNMEIRGAPKNVRRQCYPEPHDLHNRFHLLLALYERLHYEYTPAERENGPFGFPPPALAMSSGNDITTHFYDCVCQRQAWTGFTITQGEDNQTDYYVLPLNKKSYLQVSFTKAPNADTQGQYFAKQCQHLIADMRKTFHLSYQRENTMR